MNKLVLDNREAIDTIVIDSDTYLKIAYIDISTILTINVENDACLEIFDKSNNTGNNIILNLATNSKVIIKKISVNCHDKITVNLNGENANIKFSTSIINYLDNIYMQDINHNKNNTKSKITNHAINVLDNELKLVVNGYIAKNSNDCTFNQDNKIMNMKSGKSFILPNLIVDNNLVEASHSAYIGSFDKNTIFYLKSRGIDNDNVNKLLIRAFIIDKMNLTQEQLDDINLIIDNI